MKIYTEREMNETKEAIRADARAEALRDAAERLCKGCLMKINLPCWKAPSCPYRAAILADESKERGESEASRDERLALKQQLGAGCHDECGDLPEEDEE